VIYWFPENGFDFPKGKRDEQDKQRQQQQAGGRASLSFFVL
jgi:hypothetical protein